ncbi:nucleotidyltransferase domain-containing protein [Niabella hibiscisoli]|uniref:nucleotidyltransferase domain-containing protein n=1 Tax=Niabella hibiscisoli TaxID=1825928 RepID=UPI001F11512F|nr:nucleotidyltransferase family protein [Niabella hibiscisoli]MCH5715069.1 nucleotidyltransferase family protein [Niabella hibiscisoli]
MIPTQDVKSKYGIEIAVVLLCCRLHFNTEELSTLQRCIDTDTIDWNDVIYLSKYHRIEPIVYKILSKVRLPAAVVSRIKQSQFALVQNNFKQALETERIITLLETKGIECTPYKGVAFSGQFYGDIISRESSDIDLVISHKDFREVLKLMIADGYLFENEVEYSYFKEQIFTKSNSLNFDKFKNDVREFHIEFHWRITENFIRIHKQAHAQLFNNSDKITLARREVNALNANAHYLTLFIHHSNHDGFRVLKNIVDLCQINYANNSAIDALYIKEAFTNLRLVKAADVCCYLSSELMGVHLPSPIQAIKKQYRRK